MFSSSLEMEYSKEKLIEKDNNMIQPISDNFISASPLLLDYQNNINSDKYINYFYTNSPFSSINEEIIDKFDIIKPIEKEKNNEAEKNIKEKNNMKEKIKKTNENNTDESEEIDYIMINDMDDIDLAKLTNISSFYYLNSTSNNSKNIKMNNKNDNSLMITKTEKKIVPLISKENEKKNNLNNISINKPNSLIKKINLQNNKSNDNKYLNEYNLTRKKRKLKKTKEKNKDNHNLLFDNDNMKENIIDNSEIKKLTSIKEKFKKLKIKIPKNVNERKIYPIPEPIKLPSYQIDSNIINNNSFKATNNEINSCFNEKSISYENYKDTNCLNLNTAYETDLNLSKIQSSFIEKESTHKYIPQIFESHAPSIIINGLEYTTILVPKKKIKKINLNNI